MFGGEVRDADRLGSAFLLQPNEGLPDIDVEITARGRPVDQVEIDIVEAEALKAGIERLRVESKPWSAFQSLVVMKRHGENRQNMLEPHAALELPCVQGARQAADEALREMV